MPQFDKCKKEDLKNYLFYSNVHDAIIETIQYDHAQDTLIVKSVNRIYNDRINLFFDKVKCITFIKGKEMGDSQKILSLTIEEKTQFQNHFPAEYLVFFDDSIYLLFQMFSGDELHIVAESVFMDIHK